MAKKTNEYDKATGIDNALVEKIKNNVVHDKGQYQFFNSEKNWITVTEKKLWMVIYSEFGAWYDEDAVEGVLELKEDLDEATDGDMANEILDQLTTTLKPHEVAKSNIKYELGLHFVARRQYGMVDRSIDPFMKEETSLKIVGDTLHIVSNDLFQGIEVPEKVEGSEKVWEDYCKHFDLFTEMIKVVTASRFATDRRQAFLYQQMISGFGKSFLKDLFISLGLLVTMNEKELKNVFTNAPVGKDANTFIYAWILFFDELKYGVSEFKELNNSMALNPKNAKMVTVPLFMKIFASAEVVDDLLGDTTDTQFAKRFSAWGSELITQADLSDRDLFSENKSIYFDALRYEVFKRIHKLSSKYIAMGKHGANGKADKVLAKFHKKYKIKATLEATAHEILEEILEDVVRVCGSRENILTGDPYERLLSDVFILTQEGEPFLIKRRGCKKVFMDKLRQTDSEKGGLKFKEHMLKSLFEEKQSSTKIRGVRVNGYFLN